MWVNWVDEGDNSHFASGISHLFVNFLFFRELRQLLCYFLVPMALN